MLKSFQRIKGLGVFADYSPPAGMVDFGVKNLIYGWNYSGKTTLSRLVAMLEAKKLNPELPQCSFTIATDAGNINESNFTTSTHVVRVFNSDFIADNLNFAGSHFKPILLLGSESEAAQKEIERCEAMHKRAAELAAAFAKESGDAAKGPQFGQDHVVGPHQKDGRACRRVRFHPARSRAAHRRPRAF